MKPGEKAALYRELAKMTAADFHLDRSLALLLAQKSRLPRRAFLEGLQRGLAAGMSVAEAISVENAGLVTGLETSMIEAGERSGKLSAGFAHLAHYFAATETARKEAWRAMLYPLVLLHLAVVLPEIPAAIAAPDGHPGLRISVTLAVLWISILAGMGIWNWLSRGAESSATIDDLLRRVPLIGGVRRHWALARFSQVFHAGLLAGLRMSEIVRMAGRASQSGRLRTATETAGRSIESGELVSPSLQETGAFPVELINAFATAEEIGSLDEEMARVAAAETELATAAIQRASFWLPKVGYGMITMFVLYRIIGMVEGYYGGLMRQFEL